MLFDPKRWKLPTKKVAPPKLTPEEQLIRDAAKLIKEKGWIQGKEHSHEGYCIVGALRALHKENPEKYPNSVFKRAMAKVTARIRRLTGDSTCIPDWNDTRGRSESQVLSLLRSIFTRRKKVA